MSQSRAALIRAATEKLDAAGVPDGARDARLLMRWAADLDGASLAAALGDVPGQAEAQAFQSAIDRRAGREPVSHITGQRLFWGREFLVTPDVLDPRPETETLIAEAINRGPFERLLDIGVGSGCILLSLLAEWPDASGIGTDTSTAAIQIARQNADRHGIADRALMIETCWADGVQGPFDLIVSNPPYIAADEMAGLSPEVQLHEPHAALSPGGDGLDGYRAIAPVLRGLLTPGGVAMLEIGPTQYEQVAAMLASAQLSVVMVIPDLDQRARVIVCQS